MLCYLQEAELRPREGKTPFFICKWNGIQGDTNAKKVSEENGLVRINVKAALARTITLTKSIFPVDEKALEEWKKMLKCRVMRIPKKNKETGVYETDENGDYIIVEKIVEENANKTVVNLLYKKVPLTAISDDVRMIEFTTSAGKVTRQTFVTVIGFADPDDNWAEEQTPEEMAVNNLTTNLNNGTYIDVSDEVEEVKPKTHVLPKSKAEPSSDSATDWD